MSPYHRKTKSALKYFLLGSFATAFLLYGVAWIYGLTGATNLDLAPTRKGFSTKCSITALFSESVFIRRRERIGAREADGSVF